MRDKIVIMAPEIIPRSESLKEHITVAVNHDLTIAKKKRQGYSTQDPMKVLTWRESQNRIR